MNKYWFLLRCFNSNLPSGIISFRRPPRSAWKIMLYQALLRLWNDGPQDTIMTAFCTHGINPMSDKPRCRKASTAPNIEEWLDTKLLNHVFKGWNANSTRIHFRKSPQVLLVSLSTVFATLFLKSAVLDSDRRKVGCLTLWNCERVHWILEISGSIWISEIRTWSAITIDKNASFRQFI